MNLVILLMILVILKPMFVKGLRSTRSPELAKEGLMTKPE